MRSLLGEASTDPRAAVAVAMFGYAICKAVGAFAAAMGGLDLLVFTGVFACSHQSERPAEVYLFLPG